MKHILYCQIGKKDFYHQKYILIGLRDIYLNLRNIKEDGHLEVITNVHELYDRWKELMDQENDLNVQK